MAFAEGVVIFVFTIVTIIFPPLSSSTSYLSMNTNDIRDMENGQWLLWAIEGPLTAIVLLGAWLVARRGPKVENARQAKKLMDMKDWKWGYRD
ncbi:hypothetical protein B0H66DRAFT_600258 [Apodospora peruviana]|uniref:Uncharacterized protein n=1 Tax=Apodospora peruviana TaxID=516989 RepID=A0AAE0IJ61_9PEZI|nr:hypothetical protein B0H66DRAFT_600258 [Apodospora peruviana]